MSVGGRRPDLGIQLTNYYLETLLPANSTTTTPHSIALTSPSTIDGLSAETDLVEPSSLRVEHMRSHFCVSDGFDLSNTSDNSTFRLH